MTNLEKKVDALVRLVLSGSEAEANNIRWELRDLMAEATEQRAEGLESKIRRVLLEIGILDLHVGHSYLVSALNLAVEDPDMVKAITTKLYPAIAAMHLATPSRVERAIRHAIEAAWDRGDLDVLDRYFGGTVSVHKGKPTNAEFIARIANVIREI